MFQDCRSIWLPRWFCCQRSPFSLWWAACVTAATLCFFLRIFQGDPHVLRKETWKKTSPLNIYSCWTPPRKLFGHHMPPFVLAYRKQPRLDDSFQCPYHFPAMLLLAQLFALVPWRFFSKQTGSFDTHVLTSNTGWYRYKLWLKVAWNKVKSKIGAFGKMSFLQIIDKFDTCWFDTSQIWRKNGQMVALLLWPSIFKTLPKPSFIVQSTVGETMGNAHVEETFIGCFKL